VSRSSSQSVDWRRHLPSCVGCDVGVQLELLVQKPAGTNIDRLVSAVGRGSAEPHTLNEAQKPGCMWVTLACTAHWAPPITGSESCLLSIAQLKQSSSRSRTLCMSLTGRMCQSRACASPETPAAPTACSPSTQHTAHLPTDAMQCACIGASTQAQPQGSKLVSY
jgi:hypothetical protein